MDDPHFLRICLLGHSFMTRLGLYMYSHPDLYILNLQEDFYSVCVYGPVVDCGSPDQLVIGTCCHLMFCRIFDFCNMVKMTYFPLVWKLSYVAFLPQHRTFILVWVLHESSLDTYFVVNRGHHRLISMNAIAINVRLQAQVSSMEGIHFWPHRGFWKNLDFLCDDAAIFAAHLHRLML